MKFNYITIMVRNLDKSRKFYTNLVGLNIQNEIENPHGRINFLANNVGETMLELIEFENVDKVETKALTLSFKVEESLEEIHKKAIELGYTPSEIIDKNPKPKFFNLQDPDGITIEFSI